MDIVICHWLCENYCYINFIIFGKSECYGHVYNPARASGPSEILRCFTCPGSPVQNRGFESQRNFWKGRFKCLGSRAVANSHAAG